MDHVFIPGDLDRPELCTFAVVYLDFPVVVAKLMDFWREGVSRGFVRLHDVPGEVPLNGCRQYQGVPQFGVFASCVSLKGATCLWTSETDGAHPLLYKLAYWLKTRCISTKYCDDWRSENAAAVLWAMDRTQGETERYVRVMREDNGRLAFFEKGSPESFEGQDAYQRRYLKERLTRELFDSYWEKLGVDQRAERSQWERREGLAYVSTLGQPGRRDEERRRRAEIELAEHSNQKI